MAKKCDFAGWATKNDVRCADGRIIRKNAFADQDGARVPLFWNHQHNDPEMVLGHAILFNKDDGVYAKGYFNNSKKAQHVKESIAHGDLLALSIYANQLKEDGSNVLHGIIRELSVVPGGANPEALIETAMLAHGDLWDDAVMVMEADDKDILKHSDSDDEEEEKEEMPKKKENVEPVEVTDEAESEEDEKEEADSENKKKPSEDDEEDEVKHSGTEEKTVGDVLKTLTEEQQKAVAVLIDSLTNDEDEADAEDEKKEDKAEIKHSDSDDKTVGDVLKTLNEEQKKAVAVLIDAISNDEDDEEAEDEETEDEEEDTSVKHNVFDNERNYGPVLSHSDMQVIFEDWKRVGSLKKAVENQMQEGGVLAHTVYNHDDEGNQTTAQTYGVADIRYLFPDARAINAEPDFITRQMDWVKKVMTGVRHTPFSRVKSIHANITMDEARAKGYVKGTKKAEEVFSMLKRVTTPQTIYKKQKLDRDDILDITDFNVVAWIKTEMRLMLEEECARAILIGDGRSSASPDKISEEHIRSMANDNSLYTVKVVLQAADVADDEKAAKALIKAAIQSRKNYKGSGNLTMFTTANWHTEMVLLEDQMGRPLYDTDDKLATKLRVSGGIFDVEPMEGVTDSEDNELMAVLVDLKDYNVGADKGGETEFFEDFDIDWNQEKYLLETRFSGALVKPYSAIAIYKPASNSNP